MTGLTPTARGTGLSPAANGTGGSRPSVSRALTAIFNCFALNAAIVIACLPLVTAPAALQAGIVVLDRWRGEGEGRVVREFIAVLRSRSLRAMSVTGGMPFVAVALALAEVQYFARGGGVADSLCLGLGVAGLLLSLAAAGYALALGARRPELSPSDVWYMAVLLAVRNALSVSPVLVVEFAAIGLLLARDPSLAVICVPLLLVGLVRLTADAGIRRAQRGGGDQAD